MNRSKNTSRRGSTPALIQTISLWVFILILAFATLPRAAHAATVSLGGNFYYMAWQPAWADGTNYFVPYHFLFMQSVTPTLAQLLSNSGSVKFHINKYKPIYGPMAGPSLSVSFAGGWSISSVFLAGRFTAKSTGPVTKGVTDALLPYMGISNAIFLPESCYRRVIIRYDSDTTLACSVHKYVRLFAGFKYQGYQYEESIDYFASNGGAFKGIGSARFHGFGGGLGLGLALPLAAGLYANLNLSGLCMYGIASYKFDKQYVYDLTGSFDYIFTQFSGERYWSAGGNSTLSLSYQFEKAGVTLSLGFRYQALYYFWQANNPQGFLDYYGRMDHSYGGSFSITYSFGGKKTAG